MIGKLKDHQNIIIKLVILRSVRECYQRYLWSKFKTEFSELSLAGGWEAAEPSSHWGCLPTRVLRPGRRELMLLARLKVCFFPSVQADRHPAIASASARHTGPGRQRENI